MSGYEDEAMTDELGRDMGLAAALEYLDPARQDPAYWVRFRGWVMSSAGGELARRRLMAKLTIEDVVSSWARAVLPTAMLAAAVAGLVLLRGPALEDPVLLGIEELLLTDLQGLSIPMTLSQGIPEASVSFASEVF